METKKFFLSKGFWGAFLVIAAPVINTLWGTNIDTALQAEIANSFEDLAQLVGGTLALYGRVRATKKLTL